MYVISAPLGTGENSGRHHRVAVARNMARAGANAAIARLPVVTPVGSPYLRRIPVGPNVTGRYSVTSQKTAAGNVPGTGAGFEEYDLVSVGTATDLSDGDVRVVARIRFGPEGDGLRARIIKWEEHGPH